MIYRTIKTILLFYNKFRKNIELQGFEINLYDRCITNKIVNNNQMTVLWHINNLKTSHIEKKMLEKCVEFLRTIYNNNKIGKIVINKEPVHDFVGMKLDYSVPRKSIVDMMEYIKKIVMEFKELGYSLAAKTVTPVTHMLFTVNNNTN